MRSGIELAMTQIGMVDLANTQTAIGAISNAPAAGSSWTPQHINQIITGIKDLMVEYQKLKGITAGNGADQVMPQTDPGGRVSDMQTALPGDVVTTQKAIEFGKRLCDQLEGQGFGDKTLLDVLTAFTFTIRQIKGMLP